MLISDWSSDVCSSDLPYTAASHGPACRRASSPPRPRSPPRRSDAMTETTPQMYLEEDYPDIRDSVRKICENFPGEYWRKLEAESGYPTEFVQALTEAGYLSALIPDAYYGSGLPLRAGAVILETIHATEIGRAHV